MRGASNEDISQVARPDRDHLLGCGLRKRGHGHNRRRFRYYSRTDNNRGTGNHRGPYYDRSRGRSHGDVGKVRWQRSDG